MKVPRQIMHSGENVIYGEEYDVSVFWSTEYGNKE